jgi:hypothetical protein
MVCLLGMLGLVEGNRLLGIDLLIIGSYNTK